jgi:hypothetical protein
MATKSPDTCDRPSTTPTTTSPRTMIVKRLKRSTIESVGVTPIVNERVRNPSRIVAPIHTALKLAQMVSRTPSGMKAETPIASADAPRVSA